MKLIRAALAVMVIVSVMLLFACVYATHHRPTQQDFDKALQEWDDARHPGIQT